MSSKKQTTKAQIFSAAEQRAARSERIEVRDAEPYGWIAFSESGAEQNYHLFRNPERSGWSAPAPISSTAATPNRATSASTSRRRSSTSRGSISKGTTTPQRQYARPPRRRDRDARDSRRAAYTFLRAHAREPRGKLFPSHQPFVRD
jgi:hypothetical protein